MENTNIKRLLCVQGNASLKWHKETKTNKEYGQLNYFFINKQNANKHLNNNKQMKKQINKPTNKKNENAPTFVK